MTLTRGARPALTGIRSQAGIWPVAGILLLAAIVRTLWILQPRIVWGDEPFYLWLGESLVGGQGYQFFGISGVHFSPLVPLLAGLISKLFNGPLPLMSASNALYVVCGAALVLPVYGFARRTVGEAPARAAALLTAVYPALTAAIPVWGTLTEPLYLLLVASAWWALLVALEEERRWAWGLAGGFLGLAYLTRTEAIVYTVAGLGAVAVIRLATHRPERQRFLSEARKLLFALSVFFVVISPYLVVLHDITGRWQLAEEAGSTYVSAQGLAFGNMAEFDRATWGLDPASGEVYLFSPASEGQGLLDAIRSDWDGFVRLLGRNVADFSQTYFSARLLPWYLLPFVALGLFARPWTSRRLRGELLLLASFAGPLSFLPFFIQDRYIAGALLPALIWAGAGTVAMGQWIGTTLNTRERWPAVATAAPVLVLVVMLLWQGPRLRATLTNTGSFQPGHVALSEQLRSAGAGEEIVLLSRYPAIAFHAGVAWAPTPAASWPDVLAYAGRKSARYIAIDAYEAKLRPQLAFLLDPKQAPPALELVGQANEGRGPVVLYRFR